MSPSALALELGDVRFAYHPARPVLDIPQLRLTRGSRTFLHGPSGSGKTTLLGLIAGILQPQAGRLQVLGQDLGSLSGRARDRLRGAQIGYIFQMFNLLPYLNVRDNILLPCRVSRERRARLGAQDPAAAAQALAQRLGMGDWLDAPVTELSVGQQQRVAAARALLGGPALLIADEPTSALDSDHRSAFLDLLFAECERVQTTLLFVSHDHGLRPLFAESLALAELNRVARPAGARSEASVC